MRRISSILSLFLISLAFLSSKASAQASIEGVVRDSQTGEPLMGATVILIGTSKGATSNPDGKYAIRNVPAGQYTIRTTFIGYVEARRNIALNDGAAAVENFSLEPVTVEGQEVVVTGQALGQKQAINQQLAANNILNAVSSARIQELPDANAAESIARLPGISVLREGGEGNQVIVRGLAPKYNQITIDGVQMSTSSPNDRSADLSMVSSNMLEGIQVAKSNTADMDADVLGGTVNFELREARQSDTRLPVVVSFLAQAGYNNLSNAYNKYNNYKYVGSIENRFSDGLFGVFAQIDLERKNLTSNELGASYTNYLKDPKSQTDYQTTGLTLSDIPRDRQRINGALVMDYLVPDGKFKLTNFVSSGNTDTRSRQEFFDVLNTQNNYTLSYANSKLTILSNSLDYKQAMPIFNFHSRVSHTYSETKDPNDWSINFMQKDQTGLNQFIDAKNVNPQEVQRAATPNLSTTYLRSIQTTNSFSKERALAAVLDLDREINLSELITADFKVGGKFRHQTRSYDFNLIGQGGGSFVDISAIPITSLISQNFGLPPSDNPNEVPMTHFVDPSFSYGKFLEGDYQMGSPLDFAKLNSMVDLVKANAYLNVPAYAPDAYNSQSFDYSGFEDRSAFYVMSVFNIGQQITFIPGLRYQNLKTSYKAAQGQVNTTATVLYPHIDSTVVQNHANWLPSASLRYKPFSWFDIRLSYSQTLAYPDYNAIIPRASVNGNSIAYNNSSLKPSHSENYDAYLSFYDNTIGLFTIGGFLKRIDNLIFANRIHVTGTNAAQYGPPPAIWIPIPTQTYFVDTYINSPFRIDNYGMELDWQTHFWYLPGPLAGLVFNVNYTHIFSKATYPFLLQVKSGRFITYTDTSYTERLLDQPNDIVNMSLGFDYGGFSARISMLYQTHVFTAGHLFPQLRTNTAAYRRWDLAVKQDLPWFNLQIYGDLNNINGAKDVSEIQGGAGVPRSLQDYGMTADLGLRFRF
ncbi:MAG: TonB-dependent receptor [Ignavibacteria bacterium]|jgi:TonB-dependent receptor|nr:TonB-dependent receptor [Ignavibacteria bacterium]MCU7511459.1 TonB-dependent receptor [Ignavibacteria bacterium]